MRLSRSGGQRPRYGKHYQPASYLRGGFLSCAPFSGIACMVTRCFLLASLLATTSLAAESSSLMDISSDGKLLACSNRDSGTVTIVNLKSHEKLSEVAVGKHPEGVTFLGDSHQVTVAVY